MAEAELYKQIASTGILGILLVASILALVRIYRDLIAEKNSRIEDATKFNTLALAMQKEMILATQSLVKIARSFEVREERIERELMMRTRPTPARPFRVAVGDDDPEGEESGP